MTTLLLDEKILAAVPAGGRKITMRQLDVLTILKVLRDANLVAFNEMGAEDSSVLATLEKNGYVVHELYGSHMRQGVRKWALTALGSAVATEAMRQRQAARKG